jgi:hypothetical protein
LVVKKRIAAIVSSFDVGDWLFNNSPVSVTGANVVMNFNGLCYGDANASYTPVSENPLMSNPVKASSGTLALLPSTAGEQKTDVTVYATGLLNMGSFQFTIRFDPSKLIFKGTSNWYPGIQDVTVGQPEEGAITFVWAGETSGISILNDRFFELHFQATGSDVTIISLEDQPTPAEFATWDGDIFLPGISDAEIDLATGLSEKASGTLSLYPNPSHGQINLEYSTAVPETINLMLINGMGQIVLEAKELPVKGKFHRRLDLNHLPNGPYLLKIQSGSAVCSKVLVLQD